MKTVYLKPILSEKSHMLSHSRTYMFEVPLFSNKQEVAKAVASQYSVAVTDVRITRRQGKVKSAWARKRHNVTGTTNDKKLAYVSLQEGDNLPFFEPEHDHATDKKAKTTTKETK